MEQLAKKLFELGYCIDRHNDFSHKLCVNNNPNKHQIENLKLNSFLVDRKLNRHPYKKDSDKNES